jgi:hypothetical protein
MRKDIPKYLVKLVGEKNYLKLRYYYRTGNKLSLSNPLKFTEKIQYLKLRDKRAIYSKCADKVSAKSLVADAIGNEHVIPALMLLEDASQLTIDILPDFPVIIKTNHDSGGARVVSNKEKCDVQALQNHFNRKMERNFYHANLEWEYRDIKPVIIIERLLGDGSGNLLLNDYKIHCFHGKPYFIQTITDRNERVKETWYDVNWTFLNMWYYSSTHKVTPPPNKLNEMLEIAKTLSKPFPYVRIDLYETANSVLFGEYTFRPYGGFMKWNDSSWDYHLGALIDLKRLREYV